MEQPKKKTGCLAGGCALLILLVVLALATGICSYPKIRAPRLPPAATGATPAASPTPPPDPAKWVPDPAMMSIRCARFSKERILDAESSFDMSTLKQNGKTFTMQGVVTGHNAFNARIQKRATCSVHMDLKTGKEMYNTSIADN
jgi:hypothetical protein